MSRISCCRRLHRRPRSILCTAVLSDHVLFLLLTGFFWFCSQPNGKCAITLGAVSDLNRNVRQGRKIMQEVTVTFQARSFNSLLRIVSVISKQSKNPFVDNHSYRRDHDCSSCGRATSLVKCSYATIFVPNFLDSLVIRNLLLR